MARALTDIENAFLEKGYRVIPFGSVAENRVHGRSDLDLLVVGEMSREAQRELWSMAEDFDDFLDPHRPFVDEVDTLIALYDDASPDWTLKQFTPVFMNLFEDDRADLYLGDPPRDLAGRVRRFLDRVKHLSSTVPTPEELDRAPTLHRWCGARLGSSPFLLGHVTGHPTLRWGARAHTSVLFQVAPDLGWARTWNRFYVLGELTPATLVSFQADGKIPPAVELIRFDDHRLH